MARYIPPPREDFIDPRTGKIAISWFRYLLREAGNVDEVQLQAVVNAVYGVAAADEANKAADEAALLANMPVPPLDVTPQIDEAKLQRAQSSAEVDELRKEVQDLKLTLLAALGRSAVVNFSGPSSSTDNAIVRWDGTGGTAIQNSGCTIDDSNNATFSATVNAAKVVLTTTDGVPLDMTGAYAGTSSALFVNSSNNAAAEARVFIQVGSGGGGATAGDPHLAFGIQGVINWSIGIDNSASDSFKISNNLGLGTNDYVTIGTSGNVTLSGTLTVSGGTVTHTGLAFASLPTAVAGMVAYVTDSNTATWGATVAGGGANKVLVWYNGTNWTVAGA